MKRIVLAGGCFWGVEAYYKQIKGVVDTNVGYTNGNKAKPSYEDLKNHLATHAEAVEIYYDEKILSLEQILDHLFRIIDPTSLNRQGGDFGIQYRTGVYYQSEEDKHRIEQFFHHQNQQLQGKLAVELAKEKGFYLAEDYHQDYLDHNPNGYCHVDFSLIHEHEKK
ncbi:MAG TPA: peptide-methionine (S)-S-oxide reductase MsrA [Bacilli bacterium]|nr:MAG: Peptide methionine sulfoxide reductase MsrA/MsrB [Tenericutes bacterium ADurb.BinA124]HNZ50184.1 peptide-methionine (S)-S-oxide reductase MsrA [Bacilli bacterium]HOH17736.1 peptide-methionine (S)-S-oxide reductase MsrA [Bacilli bacterium]HPX84389.1 peptide-methionine (S)-S-oxide reductase MsrA [Bacilli bacterium]HQC74606.1 peptide-methionine (S)-S-oxide reductase MsrA [Bacilli bacterium]